MPTAPAPTPTAQPPVAFGAGLDFELIVPTLPPRAPTPSPPAEPPVPPDEPPSPATTLPEEMLGVEEEVVEDI